MSKNEAWETVANRMRDGWWDPHTNSPLYPGKKAPPTVAEAIERLGAEIGEDEGYRIGWQANLAMAFLDAFYQEFPEAQLSAERLHWAANQAADSFICRCFNVEPAKREPTHVENAKAGSGVGVADLRGNPIVEPPQIHTDDEKQTRWEAWLADQKPSVKDIQRYRKLTDGAEALTDDEVAERITAARKAKLKKRVSEMDEYTREAWETEVAYQRAKERKETEE